MEHEQMTKAIFDYQMHIADNQTKMVEYQTRMTEALARMDESLATISAHGQATAAILERVIQQTDRTERMVAQLLTTLVANEDS